MTQDPRTTTPAPSGDSNQNTAEMEALQLRQQKAETEKAIADAGKAASEAKMEAIKAKWAQSDTKGKEGKITLKDSAGYFAEILAYLSMDSADNGNIEHLATF